MILQSLVHLFDSLAAKNLLEQPGWSPVPVSWALEVDDEGKLLMLVPLETPQGEKNVLRPRNMKVPAQAKRSVNIAPNFLCDNCAYVLGLDVKDDPARALRCFEAFRDRQHALLDECAHPSARALLRFLDHWEPEKAAQHPALQGILDGVRGGRNLVFLHNNQFLHEIPALRELWQRAFSDDSNATVMQCLVTGERGPIQVLHPSIKGVPGAQSSGASLISFNAPSFESYGRVNAQGLNAPVGTRAAFAYGAALNYLIASPRHHLSIGDMTVVFWTEDGEDSCSDFLFDLLDSSAMDDATLGEALHKVARGLNAEWNGMPLQPDNRFFILGLAPNAARLSVRLFLCDRFGTLMDHVLRHQQDLSIVRPACDTKNELSLRQLLLETVNPNTRDKKPHPQMAGDLTRAVLQGTPYPATLFEQVQLRIRAEQRVTRGRAALIKAYLLRLPGFTQKEVLTVQLNESTVYPPYLLGRLFAVLELLQKAALGDLNATIRDRYFNSACSTPSIVFPTLIRLAQAHLKKLDARSHKERLKYDNQIGQLLLHMSEGYPARLNLQDQGVFQLGYYHQMQTKDSDGKKEENNHG